MWRQWFKGCQLCRHDFGFLVVFASILVILVITVQHLAQLLLWNTLRMDSVNGTYMICPTINCYYLMYLHYSTLIGIVRQDHNPLLLDGPYLGNMFQLDGWTCKPTKATCKLSRGTCIQWSVLVYTHRCMLLTALNVQHTCVWMQSGCVLVDGDHCMKGLTCV